MVRRFVRALTAIAVAGTLALGCGDEDIDGTGGGPPQSTTGPFQPLVVGATWTFHVDDQGKMYEKISEVVGTEDVGGTKAGITAFKVRENVKTKTQLTWYEVTATDVRRHHEQSMEASGTITSDEWYDPYILRVDESAEHLAAGASWDVVYTKTQTVPPPRTASHTESWRVDAVDESVTVPAGTFTALKITRTDTSDGSTKTQWFVRGVGKVREETGAGHFEELISYNIP